MHTTRPYNVRTLCNVHPARDALSEMNRNISIKYFKIESI